MTHIFVNNRLVTEDRAKVDCRDRGFRFGDGVFETIAIYSSTPYQWELHQARLLQGLQALKIPAPEQDLRKIITRTLKKNNAKDGFIRIAISRGVGSKGYKPLKDLTPTVIVEHIPKPEGVPLPAKLWLSQYCKPSRRSMPTKYKLAQGINSTLALMEAEEHHCDEALILNGDGLICEAASGNLFWIRNKTLYTPSVETGCLDGTTRDALLRISPYPLKQCKAWLEELKEAEYVFLTNCNWMIRPVSELQPQGWKWKTKHPVIKDLALLFVEDIKNYVEQHRSK